MEAAIRKHFKTLEITPDSSLGEVKRAYRHLKALYSKGSMALSPVLEEFGEELNDKILDEIEKAYYELVSYFQEEEKRSPAGSSKPETASPRKELKEVTGPALRTMRESMGISLDEIAIATRIGMSYLEDMENENFDNLPPPVFLRGYVASYAVYLSLDPVRVTEEYMRRCRSTR